MKFQYKVKIWREFELLPDTNLEQLKKDIKAGVSVSDIYEEYGTGPDEFLIDTDSELELEPLESYDILKEGKTVLK